MDGKKIAMIVAFRDFKDEEYFTPKKILEDAGAKVITVSSQKGKAFGVDGGDVDADLALEELKTENCDAVIFVGGGGAVAYVDNAECCRVAKEVIAGDKILGAICIAPIILAKCGALRGKKATVWSLPLDKWPIKILKENGAEYVDENVVVDGKIITANGPASAEEFAKEIIKMFALLDY